jgi:hypothetical protein
MKQVEANSVSELASCLARSRGGLIAIDGYPGAGKSTVAREVAARLGVQCVHLDDFLLRNRGSFLKCLKYAELAASLHSRPLVVEGVCLLAVLDRIGVIPDVVVYVRAVDATNQRSKNAGIVKGGTARSSPGREGGLAEEVADYHRDFRPIAKADIIYISGAAPGKGSVMESGRADVDIAYIQAKTKLALALAAGGMLTLMVGLAVLLYGVTGKDQTLIKAGWLQVSASGLGGVIMTTSVLWAYFAYQARPMYARSRESSEKYNPDSQLVERIEHESSTEAAIRPRKPGARR